MKQRHQELLERSIGAMLAAVEIYNKPVFSYRTEAFVILSINAWELLFKARMLKENGNNPKCLWVYETRNKKDGTKKKTKNIKRNSSNNPFTHDLKYLLNTFLNSKWINEAVRDNVDLLEEFRNSSVHFYNMSKEFQLRMQELGMASLRNYTALLKLWFNREVGEFDIFMMPLAFVGMPDNMSAITYSTEEKNFLQLIGRLEQKHPFQKNQPFSVTVNIDVKFSKSKVNDAIEVKLSNSESATEIKLSEEEIRDKYSMTYDDLTQRCQCRYSDFKIDKKYHSIRKSLVSNPRFGFIKLLDSHNPKSPKNPFFSEAIFTEFDKHYTKH